MAFYDVNLLSTFASLNSRTPRLPPTRWVGWVSWFLMRLISYRVFCTLTLISLFDEAFGCPGPRINFSSSLFSLLDTTWTLQLSFLFLKFCRLNVYKAMSDFLKIARCYRERRGPSWYRKEVIGMNVIDFHFCWGTLIFPLRLCLAV